MTAERNHIMSFWPVFIVGALCLAITVTLYGWVREWQEERVAAELERNANIYKALYQEKAHSYIAQLDALSRFFENSSLVDAEEFRAFLKPVIDTDTAIEFFAWAPLVPVDPVALLNGNAPDEQAEGREANGSLDFASYTLPLTYVYPTSAEWSGLGRNLLDNHQCRDLLWSLGETGDAGIELGECTKEPFYKWDDHDGEHAFIFQPVYENARHSVSPEASNSPKGFVLLAFHIGESYEASMKGTVPAGIDVEIITKSVGSAPVTLYQHLSRSGRGESGVLSRYLSFLETSKSIALELPSANWELEYTPTPNFYAQHYKWHAESVAAFGILISLGAMFAGFSYTRRYRGVQVAAVNATQNLNAIQHEQIAMLESISDVFFSVDVNWALTYANPKAEDLFGGNTNVLAGKNLWDVCPELSSYFYRPLYKAMNEQKFNRVKRLFYPPRNKWFSLRAYPGQNNLSVYMMDITEEENSRRQRMQAETRTRAILETAVDGVLTIDQYGIIQSINPAAEGIFGYQSKDVIGENINILMPEPYHGEHDGYLRNYVRSGEAKIIGIGREVTGLRSNGEEFPLDLSVSQFQVEDGVNFTGIVRDITAQKKAMQDVIDAKEIAELANSAKSSFLGSMSHELRTPLNAVIGFSQLLAMDVDQSLTERQKEYIGDITRSGELLLQLVSQILDLSTIESGKLEMNIEDIDAGMIVQECQLIINGICVEKGLSITNNVPADSHQIIRTDGMRLKQVLMNLLSNAVKYNKEDGSVIIDAERGKEGFLRLSITDTGCGLSLDQQERVFDPFDRLGREALSIEGTGIGLTIAKNLMEVLGGRIGVISTLGEGSTFWIDVPLAQATGK